MFYVTVQSEAGQLYALAFEHSLLSISRWEEEFEKPFLSPRDDDEKSQDELIQYIYYMANTVNPSTTMEQISYLTKDDYVSLNEYIAKKRSATWFSNEKKSNSRSVTTAEVVYAMMVSAQVPIEFERWNFNRLMILLRVVGEQNNPDKKKKSKAEILKQNQSLNAKRRAQLGHGG